MKKLIVPTGYMGSGSSAITDLIAEFKDCVNDFSIFEYVFLHCPNGVFDLEDKLLVGNNAIRSDEAIRSFEAQMKKLYDKKFWWVGNYKKIIGEEFIIFTQDYIKKVTQYNFDGYWYTHEEVNFPMFIKLLIRKPFKIVFRNKLFNKNILRYKDGMKLSYIKPTDFYKFSKEYIYNIINIISKNKDNVVMDQLLLPFNLFRVDNYFEKELKVIVVERDPRDVFILNKYIWGKRKIAVPFPLEVNEFCEFYKNMRESEKLTNSEKILRIKFEDLVYNYEDTVENIIKFLDFKKEDHIHKKEKIIPELSIKNTQVFNGNELFVDEVKTIEKKLNKYLYNFPYELNNKVEESVEFD